MRTLLALAVAMMWAAPAQADDPPPPKIEDAIQAAARADKPLLVELSASWCGPCKQFEATTLPDPRVKAALAAVSFVRYDAEAPPGDAAAERYHVSGYPTFLVIDAQGVARATHVGAYIGEPGIQEFLAVIAAAPGQVLDEPALRARVQAHPKDAATRMLAARWYVDRGRAPASLVHYDVVAGDRSAPADLRAEATAAAARIRRQDRWRRELIGEKRAMLRASPAAASLDDIALATIASGSPETETRALLAAAFAASQADTDRVNSLVYIALAAGAKDEALAAAKKMTETRADAQHLDTLAECQHVTGHRDDALQIEDKAIALAKHSPLEALLAKNRARFAAGTGKADEVIQLEARVDDTWKRLAAAEGLAAPDAEHDETRAKSMAQFRQLMQATDKLGRDASAACKKDSGGAEQAIATLTLDAQGHVQKVTLLVEPGSSKALVSCLNGALANATLPMPAGRTRATVFVNFKHP